MKRLLLAMLIVLAAPRMGSAYKLLGRLHTSTFDFRVDTCTIPIYTPMWNSLYRAFIETQRVTGGILHGLQYAYVCGLRSAGVSEITRVDLRYIDATVQGLTWNYSSSIAGIEESDIMIDDEVTFDPVDPAFLDRWQGGEHVILHEMGHAMGLAHEVGFAVMNTKLGPYFGGYLKNEFTPDDVAGLFQLYRSAIPIANDVMVSSQIVYPRNPTYVIPGDIGNYPSNADPRVPMHVCRGNDLGMISYTVGNRGWAPSPNYKVVLSISQVAPPDGYYVQRPLVVGVSNVPWLLMPYYSQVDHTLARIPTNTPNGLYFLYIQAIPGQSPGFFSDSNYDNNVTHSVMRFYVGC